MSPVPPLQSIEVIKNMSIIPNPKCWKLEHTLLNPPAARDQEKACLIIYTLYPVDAVAFTGYAKGVNARPDRELK